MDNQSDKSTKTPKFKIMTHKKLILPILILVIGMGIFLIIKATPGPEPVKETILTKSTLQKIINVSELSTFQSTYNGVAKVMNEKKPEKVDYYVSYEAKVYVGIDFEDIEITIDDESKKIIMAIPTIKIIDTPVNIASLDYMFVNDKANISSVSEQAYKACEADVANESKDELEIYELAAQSAKNIVKALVNPFIEQLEAEYELEIIVGGV